MSERMKRESLIFTVLLSILFLCSYQIAVNAIDESNLLISSLCVGGSHMCAVFNFTLIKCSGQKISLGLSSTLGDNYGDDISKVGDNIPYMNISANSVISKVACGAQHTCFHIGNGEMKCVGYNPNGEVGIGATNDPIGEWNGFSGDNLPAINFGNGLQVFDLSLGAYFTCGLLTGNNVKCFGLNNYGQLGQGSTDHIGMNVTDLGNDLPFIDFGTNVTATTIHSGPLSYHSCVILSAPASATQRIKCWGFNMEYQLGYGNALPRGDDPAEMGDKLPLVDLGSESKVKQLAIGGGHTCALLVNNILKCWGIGIYGQLGSGATQPIKSTGNALPFVKLDTGKVIKYLVAGSDHNCIVYSDMLIMKCFGFNDVGELGQGDTTNRGGSPTTIIPSIPSIDLGTNKLKINAVYSGAASTCVIFEDSSVKCFGFNGNGELALGSLDNIGDNTNEMGLNLKRAILLQRYMPTLSPTKAPTATQTCNYPSKKKCSKDKTCIWKLVGNAEKCVIFSCSDLIKKKECKRDKRCEWNVSLCSEK